ncbi:MAG: hypothetical protein WAW17_19560 [Rhodococcus sp. (in: high G+C Gram-positive bacteria)]|uniref:hypothetical protein n=1 Tax=Rhodococcus sp. TaxID=1831 RepID=UPI003BB12B9E
MGLLDATVAFITGGVRGHGRTHAITSAREGADTIPVDIDDQRDTGPYTMTHIRWPTRIDLAETVRPVES